jgi:hypothetical protein
LGVSDSELPIENSDGWRYDLYAGTIQDPIPCYDTADDEEPTSQMGVAAYAADEMNAVIIPISSDEEELLETQPVQEAPFDHSQCTTTTCFGEGSTSQYTSPQETRDILSSYLNLEGLFLNYTSTTDTSDSDYVPPGRPFVPETVRRTSRQHGWFPGMYQEGYQF